MARHWRANSLITLSSSVAIHDAPYYVQLAERVLSSYRQLLNDIDGVRDDGPTFCANDEWYGKFKPLLDTMVGWDTYGYEALQNEKAYNQCYDFAYELLPDCKTTGPLEDDGRCAGFCI